jgi:hypothetical protein
VVSQLEVEEGWAIFSPLSDLYKKVVDGWPAIAEAPWTFAAIMLAFDAVFIPTVSKV